MYDSWGGNDVLIGGASSNNNRLYGDAYEMSGGQGGNDALTGGSNSLINTLHGDAYTMSGGQGGNDVLIGGALSFFNFLYGDALTMSDSQGGNDVLTGGNNSAANFLYGDAGQMSDSQGGNDVLTGGNNSVKNFLFGDASQMSDSRGGNDILSASDNLISGSFGTQNSLYGDAQYHVTGNVICGNDRLISGTGNDAMWGDIAGSGVGNSTIDLTRVTTGQDIFVFSANNGTDTIHDFRHGEDKIELNGIGVASFDELMSHLQSGETNTVITFESNTITVIGVTEMTAADFLFT
jgi:Ca2+-binding RTX toxin-like protein